MRKQTKALLIGATTCAVLLAAAPADAASHTCHLGTFDTSCTSGIINAYPGGNWVDIHITSYTANTVKYQVVDEDTKVTVASGQTSGGNGVNRTIGGLVGRYRLKMQKQILGAGADGVIENELP
ncbi:hypothetical protein [Sphaerisporangium perillae]|uniref:hypothetical protein n=1 Tax=Sphaerisporangium perillae TaxID=2935860 RepID=UPI00200EF24F|nr:hypothetical protein [Sphaerisporangium perillae]